MEEAAPLSQKDRDTVAAFADALRCLHFMRRERRVAVCCEIVAQVRAGARPKDLYAHYPFLGRSKVYRIIGRARAAGVLPPFRANPKRRAQSQVTEFGLGSMYAFAHACGDDLLHWIIKHKPEGSTSAEFMIAILRDAMFEDEDEANAEK